MFSDFLAQSMLQVLPELKIETKKRKPTMKKFSVEKSESGTRYLKLTLDGKVIEKELPGEKFTQVLESLKNAKKEIEKFD